MSVITTFIIGLFGLGILIFIHESGHFLACKAVGIEVEAFALGWGKPIFRKKWRGTEYRISMFPVGGYCKMKGEEIFKKAIEENSSTVQNEKGSMFSASPARLIFTYFAGPLANLVTAILMFALIWFAGYSIESNSNRIVLVSDFSGVKDTPSDIGGLQTGDTVIRIGEKEIENFNDLRIAVSQSHDHTLEFTVLREGGEQTLYVTPKLNRDEAVGQIGVYSWIEPVISEIKENTPAAEAGLQAGDLIIAVNGKTVHHGIEIEKMLEQSGNTAELTVLRNNSEYTTTMNMFHDLEGRFDLGFSFSVQKFRYREKNPIRALALGTKESFETLGSVIKSIGLLFKGIKLKNTVASPIRISYIIGDNTKAAFKSGVGEGLAYFLRLLALISIVLFFSNLLPIPALDGGMILFNLIQLVTKKPLNPRIFYRYNLFGFLIIIAIIVLALINDISFFSHF